MLSDQSNENKVEKRTEKSSSSATIQAQYLTFLPFGVQLENIVPTDIVTRRRSPTETINPNIITTTHINIGEITIDTEKLEAQVVINITVRPTDEPQLFGIVLKFVGIFSYVSDYSPEVVKEFLQNGSLSIVLPFARELLLSLCTRLQIPLIVLPLIQFAPPLDESSTENSYQ